MSQWANGDVGRSGLELRQTFSAVQGHRALRPISNYCRMTVGSGVRFISLKIGISGG